MSRSKFHLVLSMLVLATLVQDSPAQEKPLQRVVTEKPLGPLGDVDLSKRDANKPTYWISPDSRHFAYLIDKGIVIDGQAHKFQYDIKPETFLFSPDSQRTAFVVLMEKQGETLVLDGVPEMKGWNFISHKGAAFSPDSKHVAYIARRYVGGGVEYVLKIDGQEREVFKESPAWSIYFTTDNRRVLWGEDVGEHTLMRETSIDGSQPRIERSHRPALMTINCFFGGGGQMGYAARDLEGKHFVFYDNKEDQPRFKSEIKHRDILLSTDGKHLAYIAEPASFRTVVVVDGKQSQQYGGLDDKYVDDSLTLSPDGLRSAYAIKRKNSILALIDGKLSKEYRAVSGFAFSPDSKRVAYRAILGDKLLIVTDGQAGGGYDELGELVFSPDSKSLACGAVAGKSQFVVLNGKNQKAYAEVGHPAFSPDSKRLVYEAEIEAGDKSLLIENGKEGKLYDDIKNYFYFSDDSRHLATVAIDGDHQFVLLNGHEGNRYDTIITLGGAKIHFDSPTQLHYLAAKGGQLFLVEETLAP